MPINKKNLFSLIDKRTTKLNNNKQQKIPEPKWLELSPIQLTHDKLEICYINDQNNNREEIKKIFKDIDKININYIIPENKQQDKQTIESINNLNMSENLTSHYHAFSKCANENKIFVVLHGSFTLAEDFEDQLIEIINKYVPNNFNMCYLTANETKLGIQIFEDKTIKQINGISPERFIYIIRPIYAKKLIKNIKNSDQEIKLREMLYYLGNTKENIYILQTDIVQIYNNILFTGGIGDFLALDYFYDLSKYQNIYLMTAQAANIKNLIDAFPKYKYDKITLCDCQKQFNRKCYNSMVEIMVDKNIPTNFKNALAMCDDFSISVRFPEIKKYITENGKNKINIYKKQKFSSSVLQGKLCDISYLNLPENYYFIAHNTVDTLINCIVCHKLHKLECPINKNKREFIEIDWLNTIEMLTKENTLGVVIGTLDIPDEYKKNSYLINMTGQTNIVQGFEVLKHAIGYIGIDTCYSIIASKIFPVERCIIKSVNINEYNWKEVYLYDEDHQGNINLHQTFANLNDD